MNLPTSIPEHDLPGLRALQQELLVLAEQLLGERNRSKIIHPPSFHDNGPRLRNTSTLDGAFAELSPNSKTHWPTAVYEMAHETIHLLNPTVGHTNWLEEGVAVEFSIHAQCIYNLPHVQEPKSGAYFEALQMVRALPGGTFSAAYHARAVAGSLNSVTVEQLCTLFPTCQPCDLRSLLERCVPR